MANRITVPPRIQKQPFEKFDISCDFSTDLAIDETIDPITSVVAAYTKTGTDVSAEIIVSGTLAVSGTTLSTFVQGGSIVDGYYKISFRAVTSQDRQFERDILLVIFD